VAKPRSRRAWPYPYVSSFHVSIPAHISTTGGRTAPGGRATQNVTRLPSPPRPPNGPVAPVVPFRDLDEAARLATETEYGLSLGILTGDIAKGLALADRIPTGLVHINDQTVNDEATVPFGGLGDSGNGSRHGGAAANLEAFTEQQWVTVRGEIPGYPF
jgi:delta 1-pyrroline-5-carboxylate dehydrogenase